jgi:hypothetical protein
MPIQTSAAAAAIAALFALGAAGQAAARPHPVTGHNIAHPKGIAPGQGGGAQHAGNSGGHQGAGQTTCYGGGGGGAGADQQGYMPKKKPKHPKKNDTAPDGCIATK